MQPITNVVRRRYAHVPWLYRVYLRPGERHLRQFQGWWRVRRSPTLSLDDYRDRIPLGELEEFTACALCGETRQQPLYQPRAPDGGWRYRVVRCPGCGFLYRNPNIRPDRLGDLYATGYSSFLTGRFAENRQRRYRVAMEAVAPLFADGSGRRLLDFGCGAGLFLELAEELGFDGYGVDLSPDSIEQAEQRLERSRVHVGAPTDVPEIADGGLDVITMWSVLAHLPRPVDDLTMLRGLLAPQGVLVVFTVNAGSLLLPARGSNWSGFTRNHLMFYRRDTLPRLLEKAGFAAVGFASFYGEELADSPTLPPTTVDRIKRRIDATDGGNMLIAVGFATSAAVDAWGGGLPDLRRLSPAEPHP